MKDKLVFDFGLKDANNIADMLDSYVYYFNNDKPTYASGYKSPVQYKPEQGFL
ncbi:MAG TPA: hypothetical protein DDZ99_01295 [Clostridiales bacterium]|nr:hypothetical protein [Clostridiales bacterium]